ncbi:response regulator [Niabella sp. CJ426]|uniref:response regulator n=2 Tax=unclassified Niabella TaxID=2646634 RepID=UPI003CFFBC74
MSTHKLILIVDDDHVYKLVMRRMIHLCCSSAEIIVAANGLEAMNLLQPALPGVPLRMPDIILLDIEMPVMNGWGFLNAFSSLPPEATRNTDIYIVSSSIDEVDQEKTRIYTAVKDLLIKPLSAGKLNYILNKGS